jgi:DNA repair exonuclease SbcCD nuclease subunit
MKFIHAADIHLDSPLQSLALQDQTQITRMRRACRDAFEGLVDFSIEQQVAFVLLAGDLYDHDSPNMQTAVFLRNQLARLEQKRIRVVIVKGNHDANNKITSALALPSNTRILSDRKPETVLFDDLPVRVAIHGQSFKAGPVSENLAVSYPAAIPGHLNIGILHTSLSGDLDHDVYAPCKLEDLTTRGYDYWALGHIHKGAKLASDPWVVYPGNLQGRHAKETGPKGCMLVTVDDDRVSTVELIDLAVVRWELAEVELKGKSRETELIETIRAALAQAYKEADNRPTAVRLVLSGETSLHGEIERRPKRLLQTVLELAAEIGGDDIWIEKIRNNTVPVTVTIKAQTDETTSDLMQIMEEVAADTTGVNTLLQRELEPLRTKLPEELKELSPLKLLDDPSLVLSALSRLKPRLASRLAGEEDA